MILTPAAMCREAFDLFDTDGSGTIDAKELKVAMRYASNAQACVQGLFGSRPVSGCSACGLLALGGA